MAAIDPDETPEHEDGIDPSRPRATLKLIRPPPGLNLDEDDDEDSDEDEDDEDSDEEETNGGPSDKEKARKLKEAAALKEMEEDDDEDEDDEEDGDFDLQAAISKLVKGKAPASADDDDDDDESEESLDVDEAVVCTLDPEKNYQQPLDITVAEGERIFFKVTGTHSIFLTGNYVMPMDDHHHDDDEDEDEDDYNLSPDEDELDMDIMDEDDEEDDLDGLQDPRITEVDSDEEAPKLVNAKNQKGKNKRAAETEESLEDLMAKEKKPAAKAEEGLSKKQQKKMKKNNGEAAEPEQKKDGKDAKEGKKVQFAKNLEQGPTPSAQDKKPADATTGTLGVKNVGGVTIDDKKLGKGVAAKSGNTVSMRYIGKLEDGKVFDCTLSPNPPLSLVSTNSC